MYKLITVALLACVADAVKLKAMNLVKEVEEEEVNDGTTNLFGLPFLAQIM